MKKMCNCQKNADPCPLEGNCLVKGVVYQATVTETLSQKSENYIGLTDTTFKERHRNHNFFLQKFEIKTETELSVHLWKLKEQKIKYTIKWKIIDKGKSFNPVSKICQLCTKEKYYLIFQPKYVPSMKTKNLENTAAIKRNTFTIAFNPQSTNPTLSSCPFPPLLLTIQIVI